MGCSICGSTDIDTATSNYIWRASRNRGRDAEGKYVRRLSTDLPFHLSVMEHWIGNHRATPTTEVEHPIEAQPVGTTDRFVLNGVIANDKELGVRPGEADTSVLPRVLDVTSLEAFRDSLLKIKGSYAIAVLREADGAILLACNYKPIWIAQVWGEWYFSSLEEHFPPNVHPWRMPAYSVMDLISGDALGLPRLQSPRALVIASSGLDSTAVAAYAATHHNTVRLLHFNYGCRAETRETERIHVIATYLDIHFRADCTSHVYNLSYDGMTGGSPLLNDTDEIAGGVEGTEYAHEWVPARNLVMLSIATAYAEANGYGHIYLGTNLEEGGAYPDNEYQFLCDFNTLLANAVQNGVKIEVHTPVGNLMKHEIVKFGTELGTPFGLTWSCYQGGLRACGKCGPCFMRMTAFKRNGMRDPIEYSYIPEGFYDDIST